MARKPLDHSVPTESQASRRFDRRALLRAGTVSLVSLGVAELSTAEWLAAEGVGSEPSSSAAGNQKPPAFVELHFPTDRSLGRLVAELPDSSEPRIEVEARGVVRVSRGRRLTLMVRQPACDDLSVLLQPVREGLTHLYLFGLRLSKQNIDQLARLVGVTSLNLTGELDDDDLGNLARLTSLTALSFGGETISDAGIAHLAKLRGLESLDILGTQMSDDSWVTISKLTALKSLRLGDRTVTDAGFAHLESLAALEHLQLDYLTSISAAAMAHVGRLQNLKTLDLGMAQFDDAAMAELARLDKLTALDLSQAKVTDRGLKHLGGLKSLTVLTLPRGITDEGMAFVAQLPDLNHLTFDGPNVTHVGISYLAKATKLNHLALGGDQIDDRAMQEVTRLSTLKGLWLQDCPVGDRGLAALTPLKSLAHLMFSETRISDEGLRYLQQFPALTHLFLLDLAGSPGGAPLGLRHLRALTQLTSLHLGNPNDEGAPLADADLDDILTLTKLEILDLSHFPLSDAGAERIAKLPRLRHLELDVMRAARLTDQALAFFAGMDKLSYLSVGGNFTDRGLEHLAHSSSLRTVTLASDGLGEAAIARLRTQMNLRVDPAPRPVE